MKDVGGLVSDYKAQTERYRAEDREVRLHECRSACTLALSLPNVCVYPSSILKFHKAYNQITRETDEGVSRDLFQSYPQAVQVRLGGLNREYKVLTGVELIALGIRNCNDGATMIARAKPVEPAPASGSFFRTVLAAFSPQPTDRTPVASLQRQPAVAAVQLPASPEAALDVPLPPRRPADLGLPVQMASVVAFAPRGPREASLPSPGLPKLITGAQPVLPSGFMAYVGYR